MNLNDLRITWDAQGRTDPLWAVLSESDKKGQRWDVQEFFATGIREVETLIGDLRSLGRPVRGRALDFGCGVGRLSQPLTAYFDDVVGVDLSAAMIQLAQQYNRAPQRCRYLVNDAADLSAFPTGSFDLVVSFLTLQHVPPRFSKRYLQELVRLARPGGTICVQLPAAPAQLSAVLRIPVWRAKSALRALLSRLGIGQGARIAMYGVARGAVCSVLQKAGGRIVEVIPANEFTPGWTGYRYIATKI